MLVHAVAHGWPAFRVINLDLKSEFDIEWKLATVSLCVGEVRMLTLLRPFSSAITNSVSDDTGSANILWIEDNFCSYQA